MHQKLLGLLIIVLLSFGGIAQEDSFEIKIKLKGAEDGTKVSLFSFEMGKEVLIDEAVIDNKKCILKTKTKELRFYFLLHNEEENPVVLFLDEESKNVKLSGEYEGLAQKYKVKGSKYSKDFQKYQEFSYAHLDAKNEIYLKAKEVGMTDTVKVNSLIEELDSINEITKAYAKVYIDNEPSSPVSWMMLNEFYPITGIDGYDMSQLDNFDRVAKALSEKYPYSEYPGLIKQDVEALRYQILMMNQPAELGGVNQMPEEASSETYGTDQSENIETKSPQLAPDIKLEDPNGNIIALSSLKGQVVLLDFWASWCRPCRQENPNVVAAYNKYKDQGFTVYSVSLDEKKAAWQNAIEVDNLSWVNHVSDLKGWNSSAAALYGVQSIPSSFLIDANGVIIAQNLRGAALEQKLQEVFGK